MGLQSEFECFGASFIFRLDCLRCVKENDYFVALLKQDERSGFKVSGFAFRMEKGPRGLPFHHSDKFRLEISHDVSKRTMWETLRSSVNLST